MPGSILRIPPVLLALMWLLASSCGSGGGASDTGPLDTGGTETGNEASIPDTLLDDRVVPDTLTDGGTGDVADSEPALDGHDAEAVDGMDDQRAPADSDTGPDVTEVVCLVPPQEGEFLADSLPLPPPDAGMDAPEAGAFDVLADALLAVPSVFFVDTFLASEGAYLVRWPGGFLKFTRTLGPDGPQFDIVEQVGEDPFPCKDPAGINTLDLELAAGSNPMGTIYPDQGYEEGDPRLSFIEPKDHCFAFPWLRIAQFYDAPNAPDLHYSYLPYGVPSVGSHSALDVSQSRGCLVISGTGIRDEIDEVSTPTLADIAPTALYLMGAQPEQGLSNGAAHSSVLLSWQDGRPLVQVLEDGCVSPFRYVLIFLFDGLASNELVHLYESGEPALPAFFEIMSEGTVFQNGAVVPFPSMSLPGHLTIGTGVWPGHHFFTNNAVYDRKQKKLMTSDILMPGLDAIMADPVGVLEQFNAIVNPAAETVFTAAHRHFGDDVFTAAVNELTFGGADYSPITLARAMGDRSDFSELADSLVVLQVNDLLLQHAKDKAMLIYAGFMQTDEAGQNAGPHSLSVHEKLLFIDSQLGLLLDKLDALGIRDQTAIILTSDHGMELQDLNRAQWATPAMDAAPAKYIQPQHFGFVYIPALRVNCSVECGVDDSCTAQVEVLDDDTLLPAEGASVVSTSPDCEGCASQTDAAGLAILPVASATDMLTVSHPMFNSATVECQ